MKSPSGYILMGQPSADSIKFVSNNSTQTLRQDLTVARKAPTFNSNTGIFSVPEYRTVLRCDVPNADGGPTGQRASVDLTMRYPVGLSAEKLTELTDDLIEVITQEGFIADAIKQIFPAQSND